VAAPLRGLDLPVDRMGREGPQGFADLALAVGLSLKGWDASVPEEETGVAPEPVPEGACP